MSHTYRITGVRPLLLSVELPSPRVVVCALPPAWMQSTVAPKNLSRHPIAMTNAQVLSDRAIAVADFADAKRPNLYAVVTKLDP